MDEMKPVVQADDYNLAARFRLWRFGLARKLIHLGLRVMPDGPAKRELTNVIREWSAKVRLVVALHGIDPSSITPDNV